MFGFDHAEVGAVLAENWNLPDAIVEAISLHHQPEAQIYDGGTSQTGVEGKPKDTLPGVFAEAVTGHHEPQGEASASELTHLVAVSDYVAHTAGFGDLAVGVAPEAPLKSMEALSLTEDKAETLGEDLGNASERIDELLGLINT